MNMLPNQTLHADAQIASLSCAQASATRSEFDYA
jgi:hypothetical protein